VNWTEGVIPDCTIRKIDIYTDERGYLAETFRSDELGENDIPAMSYVSATKAHVTRGPHEHKYQTDNFSFLFGKVKVVLWDARKESPSYGTKQVLICGTENPIGLIVPPGVVHAYQNQSDEDVLIINSPNRLYGGEGKNEEVDEIRHEDLDPNPYQI